ncbi:MAG: magnesium transporter [Pirellulales bacterium]
MSNLLVLPDLREMIAENDDVGLAQVVTELHPATIADFSEGLTVEETWQLLDHAPVARQADVLSFFPPAKQIEMVTGAGRHLISKLLEAMPHDDRVEMLRQLDPEVVEDLLPLVAKADREDIRRLLSYPEASAGAMMTTDYAWLPRDLTVAQAIEDLRKQASDKETIYYIYVLDENRRMLGFVSLRHLILAKPTAKVADIMQTEVISVRVDADREEVVKLLQRYDFLAIPVLDEQHRLVGIITHDDAIDVVVEEATEDALHQAGVASLDENYIDAPFRTIWQKRAFYLAGFFVAEAVLVTSAMNHFEAAISTIVVLASFIPLCISTGGNSGAQAATLITRALAVGDVTLKDWWRILKHELWMGLALGATVGVVGFLFATLTRASVLEGVNRWMLALVIGQSVACICLWGTVLGSMLPLLFKRAGIDPGYASSPFVATLVDATGIIIYFTFARLYLL